MGATDVQRQAPNVFRMKLLGAEVRPVSAGHGTLKDAMNEALRDWVTNVARHLLPDRHGGWAASLPGTGARLPVGDRQRGARANPRAGRAACRTSIVAAVGGGSNAIGLFHPFLDDRAVRIVGVEAGGRGLDGIEHCASMSAGKPGVLHGNRTYLLQNDDGQILDGHSISAGLDYPGVGPEH